MDLTLFKSIAALAILALTILAGLWPFLKNKLVLGELLDFKAGESFATGVFFGAGMLHMLPDAAKTLDTKYPFAFLIASASFLLLLLIEHVNSALKRKAAGNFTSHIALLTAVILSVHSLLEGTAVGTAKELITSIAIIIAIVAHKGAAAFALAIQLNKSQIRPINRALSFSIFAVMTPIGIFLGSLLLSHTNHSDVITSVFNALAAGTFIYIGTLHGLERAILIKDCCNLKEFNIMLLGFGVMALVAYFV